MLKKLFSLTVAASLALSSLPVSGFAAAPLSSFNIDGISSYASVTEASFKNSSVSVINVQDLHFNTGVQKKIFSLLEKLHANYPGLELYIEGACENSDFDWVYSSLGKKNGSVFLEALFDSGNLSGAEFFAAKYGKKIKPLEDKPVFDRNLLLYSGLIEQRAEIESLLLPLQSALASLRNKYFSEEQKRIFAAYAKYREGLMSDTDYFYFLKKESLKNGIDINEYPNIALYALTSASAAGVSRKRLQSQMSSLFSNLKTILSYKQYRELIALSDNLKDRQALVSYLYRHRENINLAAYPELNKFIVSIALSDKLNNLELIYEEDKLSEALSAKTSSDRNSDNILFLSRFMEVYKNVLMTSATAYDYRYFQDNIEDFKTVFSQYIADGGLKRLASFEGRAREFNDNNLLRNEIFISKMLGDAEVSPGIRPDLYFGTAANARAVLENSSKTGVKVIVAGGFHTDGINDILNKKRINNVTFMPKADSSPKDFSRRYVEYAKTLHSSGGAAIPLPVYNELSPAELAARVLDALVKERFNKGFDLSSGEIKKEVESFLSARKEIKDADFSYDEANGRIFIEYKRDGSAAVQTVSAKLSGEPEAPGTELTMLGDITPAAVRAVLKGVSFGLSSTIPNFFIKIVKNTDYYREKYNASDLRLLKEDISSGNFDYEDFFTRFPFLLNEFIVTAFSSMRNLNEQYPDIYEEIKEKVSFLLNFDDVEVRIVDSSLLINEEGWCLAALRREEAKNSAVFYIHANLVEALKDKKSGERDNLLRELIMHEAMETSALYDRDSEEYFYFGKYLEYHNIGEEGRTTKVFHEFINSPYFRSMLRKTINTSATQKGQQSLLALGAFIWQQIFIKHEEIQQIYKIDSFEDIGGNTEYELVMLRLGDEAAIKKYAEQITAHIRNNILTDDGASYAIAVRHTHPMHVMQKVGELVHQMTGIEIIKIVQDEYMDYAPMEGHTARENISGKFSVDQAYADNVGDKNIIILEDVTKTGFVFGEISKPLNKYGAAKIIPLTVFNIIDALAPGNIKGVEVRKPINELFNINDYLTRYMRANPDAIAEKIIEMNGNTTKYFYYALSALMIEDQKAFGKIIRRLNKGDASDAKKNLIENMNDMHKKYPNTASKIIPLIFFIENDMTPEELKKQGYPLTEYFQIHGKDVENASSGILELSDEEFKKWGEFQWLLPLYCSLSGFTKIRINLQKPGGVRSKANELMLRAATQLNINIVYRYKSDQVPEIEDENLKKNIREAVKAAKLTEAADAAREAFKKEIRKTSGSSDLYSLRPGSEAYKNAIKKIMAEVNDIVRDMIIKEEYLLPRKSYSIAVGGSLVNGSAAPSSDIYYDIIAKDSSIAGKIQEEFLPVYQYALYCAGLSPFVSNGMKIDYPGSSESNLMTMLDATIYDERSIAVFFDLESVYPEGAQESEAFSLYQQNLFEVLIKTGADSETLDKRKQILDILTDSIIEVSKPYYKIIESGFYSLPESEYKSAERTFFGNLYASSYSDSIGKAYDYRWVIRGIDVALKEILLRNIDKIDSLEKLPKDKKELVMYMFEKNMFGKDFTRKNAEDLQQHIRLLSKYRQEKVARGEEYRWTERTVAERNAMQSIHSFITKEIRPNSRASGSEFKTTDSKVVKFVAEHYTPEQLKRARVKVRLYEEWAGKSASAEMSTALLLAEFSYKELTDEGGILEQLFAGEQKYKLSMKSNIDMLFSLRKMPSIDKIKGDFGIQTYMDAILTRAGGNKRVYAVFADKVSDFLFPPRPFAKFFESDENKIEEFIDYNKLADYYMLQQREILNEKLQTVSYEDLKDLVLEEHRDRIGSAPVLDILDRSKISAALKDGVLKDLGENGSLKALMENGHIAELLTSDGAEAAKRKIKISHDLEKLAIYLIYIPLARRINDIEMFENIRNLLFQETQPEIYLLIKQTVEDYVNTDLRYADYKTMLADLKKKVSAALNDEHIIRPEVHTRVKSIYSIFEKILSTRKGDKNAIDLTNPDKLTEEERKQLKTIVKEKVRDIYGFHIVVERKEMENAMRAVENAFGQTGKSALYTLKKRQDGEIDRQFDYDIKKGFARAEYTYEINGLAIGEIIIYSREEYENEHNGLITRADPVIDENETSNAAVRKAKSFILTFPLAHWIYKMGEKIKDNLRYADSIFKMKLAYSHLFYGDGEALKEIESLMKTPEFYFYSDDLVLDDNREDTLRKLLNIKMKNKKAFIVMLPDGNVYPVMLESSSYEYYEILAVAGLNADKNYVLTDETGKKLNPAEQVPFFVKLVREEGANPFDREFDLGTLVSLRARILASLRGQPLGEITSGEYFSRFSPEDRQSVEIYSNSLGLKNVEELYYAESISPGIAQGMERDEYNIRKYELVNKEELEAFVEKRKETAFEIRRALSVGKDSMPIAELLDEEVRKKNSGRIIYAEGDADKGEEVYKILYSGSSENLEDLLSALKEQGFTPVPISKEKKVMRRQVYMNALQALGRNVAALIGELMSSCADSSVLAANALMAMFADSEVNRALDGLFYDENALIMTVEADELLESVRSVLVSADAKYENYAFDLRISNNDDLIKDADIYALASLSEAEGRVTLHINEAFLRAVESFDEAERLFYLRQLALHEGMEKAALIKGEAESYAEFHKSVYHSNPDQAKLMEFAAKVAKDEILRRESRRIAGNVAGELMRSDELSAENPADILLLCGNDETAVFEKAVELYKSGAVKRIIVSGGVGRLTLPLMRKAVDLQISVPLSDGRIISSSAEVDKLEALSEDELRALVKMKEADIIEAVLLRMAASDDAGKTDMEIIKEDASSNTRENFDNDVVKNTIDGIMASNGGKAVRLAYIQTPMQQLRTRATFNSVFRDALRNGEIEGISVTVSDFYKNMSAEEITEQAAKELLRLIVYSLKGDCLPSINDKGLIFDGVLDAGLFVQITALLEEAADRKKIRKDLLKIIENTKDASGKSLFADKKSLIEALAGKTAPDSYQFETMKMFLDFIYRDIEKGVKYKKLARKVFNDGRVLSKGPFIIQKAAVKAGAVPQYLKSPERVFVFDIDDAGARSDLIAYMGSFGAKAFSVTRKKYMHPDDVLFTFTINTGERDITVKVSLDKTETENGIFYDIRYSVPFIYEMPQETLNEQAKNRLLSAVFENNEIIEKIKAQGLDLSQAKDVFLVEALPRDKTLTTVNAVSQRIAEQAGLDGQARKAESKAEKKGLYNEKLRVAAMLRSSGDTGIGEITSLPGYAETVLKPAAVNGFTMYDLYSDENPVAGNYLLLDWMSVPEAAGTLSRQELAADVSERETVSKERVARRKILAAAKVYASLPAERRSDIESYIAANESWLNDFASKEKEKYNIDIDDALFVKITALQQMFFERQLKRTVSDMSDTDISMLLKVTDADNIRNILLKWVALGITSFTVEADVADKAFLDALASAAAESGYFLNIAVKSAAMTPEIARLIAAAGYTPVVPFQDIGMYGNVAGYKAELNDQTFERTSYGLEELLENSARSGVRSVDYPIGLLWGEVVSEKSADSYRVPSKGSKRFGGLNLGLFALGQKTFEESYTGGYLNAVETGLNMDTDGAEFDIDSAEAVEINGRFLPPAYAAALIGSLAKQNRLSEVQDFQKTAISLINGLGAKENLKAARQYLDGLLSVYNSSQGEYKEINAAKIAGFLQGLSENIIINGREGRFASKALAGVFANLTAEASLFKAGYYPSGYEGVLPAETVLSKVEDILASRTLADAAAEIEPALVNLSVPVQKTGFTFDVLKAGKLEQSKDKAEKASRIYAAMTDYMLDIFIDKAATKEQIRKSVRISSVEAVRSIMSAA